MASVNIAYWGIEYDVISTRENQYWPRRFHTCHKLWTEICEIGQIFKGDLIKFCEIFTKISLELPQNSKKHLFKCKKLVINTIKCDLCIRWSENGKWLSEGPILLGFVSQCEIWHVFNFSILWWISHLIIYLLENTVFLHVRYRQDLLARIRTTSLESRITLKIAKTHISPRAKNPYHPYHTPRDPYQP